MHSTICTIGFAGKTAEEFFSLLESANVRKIVDIRENRIGQLSGFAKYPDVEFLLNRLAEIAYAYEPIFAPSEQIRKAYRQARDWSAYESSFLQLMRERGVPQQIEIAEFEGTVALLCSEPGPEKCHRRLVAHLLAEQWRSQGHTVEIRHLVSMPAQKTRKKRSKKRRTRDEGTDSE
jgi:uncharacterized protein (DUF488 family)